jgi:hypothetical protein
LRKSRFLFGLERIPQAKTQPLLGFHYVCGKTPVAASVPGQAAYDYEFSGGFFLDFKAVAK